MLSDVAREMQKLIDDWSLILGLLFGSVGLGYFIYGKRQSHTVLRYTGVMLMLYPFFVSQRMAVLIIGLVLVAVPLLLRRP